MWEIVPIVHLMEYNIMVSLSEIHELFFLTIVFSVEYDDVFIWHLGKSSDDRIDSLSMGES
jgi:hypothetical protein